MIPFQSQSATSRQAAERFLGKADSVRRLVYNWFKRCGDQGSTDNECINGLGLSGSTARPRRIELEKAGLVRKTDMVRDGSAVYVAVDEPRFVMPQSKPKQSTLFDLSGDGART